MIRGLYTSLSGMLAALRRSDVVADNIANVSTVGFKASRTGQHDFRLELENSRTAAAIGSLGTGTYATGPRINQEQGGLLSTGQPTDFAISGKGFFVVSDRATGRVALTRDGTFHVSAANGQLVTQDGWNVLDANGTPLVVNRLLTDNVVDLAGVIRPTGQRFAVVDVPIDALQRLGQNKYLYAGSAPLPASVGSQVYQGYTEASNTDIGGSMAELIIQQRALGLDSRAFSIADETLATLDGVGKLR